VSRIFGWKGNGAGSYALDANSFFGNTTLVDHVAGDFNGDGIPDIAILEDGFLINNFIVTNILNKSLVPVSQNIDSVGSWDSLKEIRAADFDNDGDVDVAFSSEAHWRVIFRMNDGFGNFPAAGEIAEVTSAFTKGFDVGDLNLDGIMDFAAGGQGGGWIHIANPVFGTGFASSNLPTGGGYDAAIGDLDGDGAPDVVFTEVDLQPKIHIALNNGSGSFPSATSMTMDTNASSHDVEIGDVTGDTLPDIVTSDLAAGALCVFRNLGGGSFSNTDIYALGNESNTFSRASLRISDVNGDGMRDVVAVAGRHLNVLLNVAPLPAGLSQFGTGTESCRGQLGLRAVAPIAINTMAQFVCTNVPPLALGLGLITNVADVPGTDLFGLDFLLHVDLVLSSEIYPMDFYSDAIGTSLATQFVPNDGSLVGLQYFAQAIWLAPATDLCNPSATGLHSPRGLAFIVQ
jgi:hypothetical protein